MRAIDADAMIDRLERVIQNGVPSENGMHPISAETVLEVIEQLPPIQPKRGKWNRLDMDTFNCNQCGATFVLNQGSEKMHFCPNCGADMREVTT